MKPQKSSEDTIIKNLRTRAENTPSEAVSGTTKIGKEEALTEAEYIVKKVLVENKPSTLEESEQIMQHAFKLAFTYLNKVGVHITAQELTDHLTREVTNNGGSNQNLNQ